MYEVHTEVILKNGEDVGLVRRGFMPETEIRQVTMDAVVDTGAWTLVINEETRLKLGHEPKGALLTSLRRGYRLI
jgi:predicted aspartyl protease